MSEEHASSAPRYYRSVHFLDYLDGGYSNSPLLGAYLLANPCTKTQFEIYYAANRKDIFDVKKPLVTASLSAQRRKARHDLSISRPWFVPVMSRVCEELLGIEVVAADFPGGTHRNSWRLWLDNGHSVIATRREQTSRALLENRVLYSLQKQDAPVFGNVWMTWCGFYVMKLCRIIRRLKNT